MSIRSRLRRLIGWRQLLYAVAVLVAAFVAFGPMWGAKYPLVPFRTGTHILLGATRGMFPGFVILLFWGIIWSSTSRPRMTIIMVGIIFFGYILTPVPHVHLVANLRTQCRNNLKQIGLALYHYHDDYKTFPPAYVADKHGVPMHSWRVLILPFLGEKEKELYEQYNFSEPWNGRANRRLVELMPDVYRCPSHYGDMKFFDHEKEYTTTYLAVVGESTMWPGAREVSISDITDGMVNTLAVVEVDQREVHWMEPRDVDFDEVDEVLANIVFDEEYAHTGGFHALQGDGAARFYSANMSQEYLKTLFTRDANDALPESSEHSRERHQEWIAYQNLNRKKKVREYTAIIFFVLTLWPLPWVWIGPRSQG